MFFAVAAPLTIVGIVRSRAEWALETQWFGPGLELGLDGGLELGLDGGLDGGIHQGLHRTCGFSPFFSRFS